MPSINNSFTLVNTPVQPANTELAMAQTADQATGKTPFNKHLSDELGKSSEELALAPVFELEAVADVLNELQSLQEEDASLLNGNVLPLDETNDAFLVEAEGLSTQPVAADGSPIAALIAVETKGPASAVQIAVSGEASNILSDDVTDSSSRQPTINQPSVFDPSADNSQTQHVMAASLSPGRLKVEMSSFNNPDKNKNVGPLAQNDSASSELEMSDLDSFEIIETTELTESAQQKQTNTVATASTGIKSEMFSAELTRLMRTTATAVTTPQQPGSAVMTDATKMPADSFSTLHHEVLTPVGNKQWGTEFSQRVSVMFNNAQQQVAELRLNPAHLGPVSVRLQIEDDKASISFVTHQTAVKEAIEVSLPKLREQLQEQGLDLAHVDVSQQDNNEASADSASGQSSQSYSDGISEQEETATEAVVTLDVSDGVSIFV
ncbi:MAG: flagellar hook-length control protein FliK [Gammaproteobacteria bacterium]|nr:flagellar hook-length control protein FliK [Gammaproteobacteria bacterium]